jgi:hypothetical protein
MAGVGRVDDEDGALARLDRQRARPAQAITPLAARVPAASTTVAAAGAAPPWPARVS